MKCASCKYFVISYRAPEISLLHTVHRSFGSQNSRIATSFRPENYMAEENDSSTYGAVASTQPLNEDGQEERLRSVDSFYEDQQGEDVDKRTLLGTDTENNHLHEKREEKQEERTNEGTDNAQNHQDNNIGITSTEKLRRPTRVSFSKDEPTNQNTGAVTPLTPNGRHVSFIKDVNRSELNDAGVAFDNRGCSDMQSSSDSLSRVRAITNCSVHYHTHSEGEECNESELSMAISVRRSSIRRRRRYTRHGTIVSDSFVNECICCCAII